MGLCTFNKKLERRYVMLCCVLFLAAGARFHYADKAPRTTEAAMSAGASRQ